MDHRATREGIEDAPLIASNEHRAFTRTPGTRLSYGVIASYAYWLYAFGPALVLLRHELHFSYTLIGVYSAFWSGGAAVSGLVFAPLVRRIGRRTTLWAAAVVAAAGAAVFASTDTVALGLIGAALVGVAGTTMLSDTQSVLADEHGHRGDKALVEANLAAAGCAVVAPLVLGALAVSPLGWRVNFAVPVLTLGLLALAYRRLPLPSQSAPRGGADGRADGLPVRCWLLAVLVALGIAVEFCLIYFGAEQIEATGLSAASATTALGAFYFGIFAGRLVGAALTARPGRTVVLLWASLLLTAAGFMLFWLSGTPAPAIAGLCVAGMGVANLYPLSLALTLTAAGGRTDSANSVTQLVGGIAVIIAPYALGSLADRAGLHTAFAIELVLIGASAVLLFAAREKRAVPERV